MIVLHTGVCRKMDHGSKGQVLDSWSAMVGYGVVSLYERLEIMSCFNLLDSQQTLMSI